MSKGFLLAFVAVTGLAVGAVDYVNETRRAGLPLGGLAPGDYVATVSGRFGGERPVVVPAPAVAPDGAGPATDTAALRRQRIETDLATLALHEGALDVLRRTGQADAATLAMARRELDRHRERLEAELAALDAAAEDPQDAGSRPRRGLRAVVAQVAGLLFTREPAPAEAEPAAEAPEVVQSLFEGNCTLEGTSKRCRIAE